ncbi:protein suppressor of hairy wing [Folsomia candida]|uniref:GDNF-inducible zinc finger protein 1 n=1 Tax=Folsomia candida TaxID=158441 RepID=A0A226F609_FOLCA|nr:protein suppressor of hairy wing [Folsomia candida]OXA64316.1 GDNF-inducible zinc finger protein 1 [Folsomia candida]
MGRISKRKMVQRMRLLANCKPKTKKAVEIDIAPLDATSPLSTKLFSDTTNNPSGRRVELVDSRIEMPYSKLKKIQLQKIEALAMVNRKKTSLLKVSAAPLHSCILCCTPTRKTYEIVDGKKFIAAKGIRILFLLHKLLQFPPDRCADLETRYGHPTEWVVLCDTCDAMVAEGKDLSEKMDHICAQIRQLQAQIDQYNTSFETHREQFDQLEFTVKNQIIQVKEEVREEEEVNGQGDQGKIIDGIAKEVRAYMAQGEGGFVFGETGGEETEVDFGMIKVEESEKMDSYPILDFEDALLGVEISPDAGNDSEHGDDPLRMESDLDYQRDKDEDWAIHKKKSTKSKTLGAEKTTPSKHVEATPPPPTEQTQSHSPQLHIPSWTWPDFVKWRTDLLRNIDEAKSSNLGTKVPTLAWLAEKYAISNFPCPNCVKVFFTFEGWSHHVTPCEERSRRPGYKCSHCLFNFRYSQSLEEHLRKQHVPKEHLTCTGCNETYVCLTSFNLHVSEVKACLEKALPCKTCLRQGSNYFPTREALEVHENARHLPDHLLPYACDQCSKRFSSEQVMKGHMVALHGPEEDLVAVCEICGAKLKGAVRLRQHIANVHKCREPGEIHL